jgi:hypothetical protein
MDLYTIYSPLEYLVNPVKAVRTIKDMQKTTPVTLNLPKECNM